MQARCAELNLPFKPSDMLLLEEKHINGGSSSSKAASSERSESGSASASTGKATLKLKMGGGRKVRA